MASTLPTRPPTLLRTRATLPQGHNTASTTLFIAISYSILLALVLDIGQIICALEKLKAIKP